MERILSIPLPQCSRPVSVVRLLLGTVYCAVSFKICPGSKIAFRGSDNVMPYTVYQRLSGEPFKTVSSSAPPATSPRPLGGPGGNAGLSPSGTRCKPQWAEEKNRRMQLGAVPGHLVLSNLQTVQNTGAFQIPWSIELAFGGMACVFGATLGGCTFCAASLLCLTDGDGWAGQAFSTPRQRH